MATVEISASSNGKHATKATSRKTKSASLPQETVAYLKAWMMSPEHISRPYPTKQEKAEIMAETGICQQSGPPLFTAFLTETITIHP
eukprot:g13700.t1 g13700   contig9:228414-229317(+)